MTLIDPEFERIRQKVGDKVVVVVLHASGNGYEFQYHDFAQGDASLQVVAYMPADHLTIISALKRGDLMAVQAFNAEELAAAWAKEGPRKGTL